ncbi:PfkB family carbohydrate kinase [Lentzea sp. NBRC 102530]|uniref:PfkB family carbohydrate kinase n=1 Tax=Lentzea sp. NBRC 102530 TaxID=3032201 RepID=UPI0024A5B9F8|nr:PfkB family carbohydrate kinase [Lentzea sp. NBRC 102530]GLY50589.1 carbohydrate kinase [Lentzea sp. NBRC 102530]
MTEARLISTGNVIVDIVMTVAHLPEPGGDVIAADSRMTAGGGLNTLVAARRAGLPVVFAGQYGTGPMADIVRAALQESGASVVQTGLDDVDSGYCVVLVDPSAERTFVTAVGAEGRLTRADLDRVDVTERDLVHVSGYSLAHPVNAAALTGWLPGLPTGTRLITDPSPLVGDLDPAVLGPVLRRTDVLSANAREAAVATGLTDLAAAASALTGRIRPGGLVVVRDGAAGCWLAGSQVREPVLVPGFPVHAVDSNGAGDAHAGVLAAGLAAGLPPQQAARRANAAAALAVTRSGPATSPDAAEVDAFLGGGGAILRESR